MAELNLAGLTLTHVVKEKTVQIFTAPQLWDLHPMHALRELQVPPGAHRPRAQCSRRPCTTPTARRLCATDRPP